MIRPRRVMRRRAIARAAVVGGAAYYAAKRGARAGRQEHEEAYVPDDRPTSEPAAQIKELSELRQQGILTEEEFAAEKKRLLGI